MKFSDELRLVLADSTIAYEKVRDIIEDGADPNTTYNDENYLHIAIRNNWSAQTIINAIELGIDVEKMNKEGYSALSLYLSKPNIDHQVVAALIKAGADPDTTYNGENYLHIAIRNIRNNWSAQTIINAIELGIDVEKINKEGYSALSLYLPKRNIDHQVVAALIKAGADPDTTYNGENYLHIAIRNKWPSQHIIKAIALGIDVNQENGEGYNAIQLYRKMNLNDPYVVAALRQAMKLKQPVANNQFDVRSVLQEPNFGATLCDILMMNPVSKDDLIYLARASKAKEAVLQHILTLSLGAQKAIVDRALDDTTSIGQFFATKRGWWATSKSRGVMADLVAIQAHLNEMGVQPANLNTLFIPPMMIPFSAPAAMVISMPVFNPILPEVISQPPLNAAVVESYSLMNALILPKIEQSNRQTLLDLNSIPSNHYPPLYPHLPEPVHYPSLYPKLPEPLQPTPATLHDSSMNPH